MTAADRGDAAGSGSAGGDSGSRASSGGGADDRAKPPARSTAAPGRRGRSGSPSPGDARHYDALGPIGGGDDIYSNVISRLLAGPAVFGLAGWFLDGWLGTSFLLPIGLIGGMTLAIYVIWLRYGTAVAPAHPVDHTKPPQEETL